MSEPPKPRHAENGDSDVSSLDIGDQRIDINSIKLKNATDFPIDLDIAAEYQNILAAGILHNSEHIDIYDYVCEIIFESNRTFKLTTGLFWIVFCIKYQPNSSEILRELRTKVSKYYAKHFAKLKSPKEEIASDFIFLFAYCVQVTFYDVFSQNRDLFTMRFILDIYHIVVFELHGLYVSDAYVQSSIEKLIGNKFFFYENQNGQSKVKKKKVTKDRRNEPLLKDLNFNPDSMMDVPGGVEFAAELSTRLRDRRHMFLTQEHASILGHFDKSKTSNSKQKAAKKSSSKPPEDTGKQNEPELSARKGNAYFPNIKFDCTQISPTVSRFLNNPTMTLPFQKKKVIKYTTNKPIINPRHYDVGAAIEKLTAKKSSSCEKEQATQTPQFQLYSLKNRGDDIALTYLPPVDKFKLKERFKEELDLKYILDHVGPYSLQSYTYRNTEEVKKQPDVYSRQYQHHRTSSVSANFYSGQNVPIQVLETKTEGPAKLDTERLHDQADTETYDTKRNSLRGSVQTQLYTDTERNSYVDPKKKPELAIDTAILTSPRTEENTNTHTTPLVTPQNPSALFKKLIKQNKNLQLFQGIKLVEQIQTERPQSRPIKIDASVPLKKFTLKIEDTSRKGKANQRRDEAEAHHREGRTTEKEFVYEDKRKQYADHAKLITKNVDKNINNLIYDLMQKQNQITKNSAKFARQIRK